MPSIILFHIDNDSKISSFFSYIPCTASILRVAFFLCILAGLPSGFVTLPRLSRLDRQFQDGDFWRNSLPDSSGFTLTRSDSLTSFTVDLGPSLMTEVLDLIDNPCCLQMYSHSQAAGEGEKEDDSSLAETPVQSPQATSPISSVRNGSVTWSKNNRGHSCNSNWSDQEEDRSSLHTPDVCAGSPQLVEPTIEPERFKKAADVLFRHYGGGSFTKETRTSTRATSPAVSHHRKTQYDFSEEEEEIKV